MARHPLDIASLAAGIAFVVIGVVALFGDLSLRAQLNVTWPLLLAVCGVALLASARGGGEGDERRGR